jgi:hypothetical protein
MAREKYLRGSKKSDKNLGDILKYLEQLLSLKLCSIELELRFLSKIESQRGRYKGTLC